MTDSLPTLLLSAGHHPGDSGARHEDITEHEVARGICFYTLGEISRNEVHVPVRVVPTDRLSTKIMWVNALEIGPCFAVEVHLNAWHESHVKGMSVFHFGRFAPKGKASGHMTGEMGKAILRSVTRSSWPSRGLKTQVDSNLKSLGWISKTRVPALLVEMGFITNRAQREFMRTDAGQQALGIRLADGLVDAALYMHSFINDDKPGGRAMARGEFSKEEWREHDAQGTLDRDTVKNSTVARTTRKGMTQ